MDEQKNGHLAEWMFRKTDVLPVPVLPKTVLQVILAAKWLVRHSGLSPKQQRRPLRSLLSNSSSMSYGFVCTWCTVQCAVKGKYSRKILPSKQKFCWFVQQITYCIAPVLNQLNLDPERTLWLFGSRSYPLKKDEGCKKIN